MPIESYEIVGGFNNQRVPEIDSERSINCFPYFDPLSKDKQSLLGTSGLIRQNIDFGSITGGFRAEYVFNDIHFVVIGKNVLAIYTNNTFSILGQLNTNSGYIGISANTFQLVLVDGVNGWVYNTQTMEFVQITDPAFPAMPIDVTYLDGFTVVANGNTNLFQLSSFNQALVWGGGSTTFTMGAASANIVTVLANSIYQKGTPVQFSGGSLPAELVAGTTYYVIGLTGTNTIQVSATPGGGAVISVSGGSGNITNNGQLQQGAITSDVGTIVACRTLHRRLFLFSQFFTEVWENAGAGTNLPFRRNNSLLMEYGTPSIGSISVGFDRMFFLSQDRDGLGAVMEVAGSQSVPISNRALDFQLAQYAANQQIYDCRAFLVKENGLIFYRMNFTLANHTYVYDVTQSDPSNEATKFWHEEEMLNGNRHVAQTHAYFNGKNYVGHYSQPILYQLSPTAYTNAGEAIRRCRIGRPSVPQGYQRTRVDRFQVDFLQGDPSIFTSPTPSPLAFLSISKDGGQTYGTILEAPMGRTGDRTFRTLWRKLGVIPRGQSFVPKLEFYNEIPFAIMGAAWFYEILPE